MVVFNDPVGALIESWRRWGTRLALEAGEIAAGGVGVNTANKAEECRLTAEQCEQTAWPNVFINRSKSTGALHFGRTRAWQCALHLMLIIQQDR
jgi:hypothetical protein